MKRSTVLTVLTLAMAFSSASTARACCYIPWLDPFAWLGFYGCGYGCGGGYGAWGGGYGGGYARYAPPVYNTYQPQVYSGYAAPQMAYPVAPASDCGCTGSAGVGVPQVPMMIQPQAMAPTMQAVQVPVTTYRAVTQYVPQTTYQTQYRYSTQPSTMAYTTPTYSAGVYPGATYSAAQAPVYSQPMLQSAPSIASPAHSGEYMGEVEYPTQSSMAPIIPNSHSGTTPVRAATYGVTPRAARTFPASIR